MDPSIQRIGMQCIDGEVLDLEISYIEWLGIGFPSRSAFHVLTLSGFHLVKKTPHVGRPRRLAGICSRCLVINAAA
jgi:hypothetical protein